MSEVTCLKFHKAGDLVNRILAGEALAETELVERYSFGLKLILLKRTGSHQLASDIYQDTMLMTLQKLRAGSLKRPESLAAFIRQIAINLSIAHFRKERRFVRISDDIIAMNTPQRDNKAEHFDRQKANAILEETLDNLSVPRDREVLRRFYLLDEDKTKICSALELSATHFDRVLYRAKKRMREMLKDRKELRSLLFDSLIDD